MSENSARRTSYDELEFALHRVSTHVLLIADLLFASRLYRVLGAGLMQPLLLGICAGTIVFYCIYTTLRGYIVITLIAAGYVALVLNQLFVFADKLWLPVNPNAFFQYVWMLSFIPFFGISLAIGRDYVLKCLAGYGTGYCVFYLLASSMQMVGVLPSNILAAIVSNDLERGNRVYLYVGLACYAYFYWLIQARSKPSLLNLMFFAVCALASVLSLSRVYLLIALVLTIAFSIRPKPSIVSFTARLILVCGSAFVMSGMLFDTFNPFDFFGGDSSGSYRAHEYIVVRDTLQNSPIWGFGVSPNLELTMPLLRDAMIFPSDLGPVGTWFDFGLLGLMFYFVALWICSKPQRSLPFEYGWPLLLTGSVIAAYGCISPLATSAGGATVTGLTLAISIVSGQRRSDRPFLRSTRHRRPLDSGSIKTG